MTSSMEALATLESGGAFVRTALRLPVGISYDRYVAVGRLLSEATDSIQWAIGDWAAFGEDVFPEEHSQAWEELGISHHSAMQYIRVSRAIPPAERRQELSWSHHRAVSALPEEQRREWLDRAVRNDWRKWQLEDALQAAREEQGVLPPPSRTFVLERVSSAAERVWKAAERQDGFYRVPAEEFEQLVEALGVQKQ